MFALRILKKVSLHRFGDIVSVVRDPYTGDNGYEARHSRVSSILFGVVCPNDDEKARQLSRILTGLDAGFSSDKRVIESVCKGRTLACEFSQVEPARQVLKQQSAYCQIRLSCANKLPCSNIFTKTDRLTTLKSLLKLPESLTAITTSIFTLWPRSLEDKPMELFLKF